MNIELYSILKASHVSEKASMVAEKHNQYVFKVDLHATKEEIKAVIEKMFNVKVLSVTTVNLKGKTKLFQRIKGCRSNSKKAYVTLNQSHSINFIE